MSSPKQVVSQQCYENSPISLLTSLQNQTSTKISPKLLFPLNNSEKQNSQNTNINTNTPPHQRTLSNFTISESPQRKNGYEFAMIQIQELKKNVDKISQISTKYKQIYPDSSIILQDEQNLDQNLLMQLRENLFQILQYAQVEQKQICKGFRIQKSC